MARNDSRSACKVGGVIMCADCEKTVTETIRNLDSIITSERGAREVLSDESPSQHCIRLACLMRDALAQEPEVGTAVTDSEPIRQLIMMCSVAIERIVALQDVMGVTS